MSAMTLLDLTVSTRELIGDKLREDPANPGTYLQGPTEFTDTEIKRAINWAIGHYCEKTHKTYAEATATVTSGGLVPLPTSFIQVVRVIA
jgi:hypothetical protein